MGLFYNQAYKLTETEVRYAMRHTTSNRDAAAFLHISLPVWTKYAKSYVDIATGKTLYDLHKNQAGTGTHRILTKRSINQASLSDILEGKHPGYAVKKLKERLIEDSILPECCGICGYNERRMFDNSSALLLVFKNGIRNDFRLANLEFVCYNCYFLYYGNMLARPYLNMKQNDPNYEPEDVRANDYKPPEEDDEIDFSQY